MKKGRLEAFSDGVLAIAITIMVLEMKAPEDTSFGALLPVIPILLSYVLSFIYIAIYWVSHHNLLQAAESISTAVLWANMHLLFWLSLIPFVTSWLGENHLEPIPVALYGGVLFMCSLAFRLLERTLIRSHSRDAAIVTSIIDSKKDRISMAIYLAAIPSAFFHIAISIACYVIVALWWIVPSGAIDRIVSKEE